MSGMALHASSAFISRDKPIGVMCRIGRAVTLVGVKSIQGPPKACTM